jgi:4-hydroxybenzoate polyprenyltransferase
MLNVGAIFLLWAVRVSSKQSESPVNIEAVSRSFISRLLEFIKFSHTLFALPFAFASAGLAVLEHNRAGEPQLSAAFWWTRGLLILAAMVAARTAAMTFNRLADWRIDRKNPRTRGRHRLISRPAAIAVCGASSLLFVAVCSLINDLAFSLSPVALATIFMYSFTKRFTHLSHFFLGFALALSPLGAWVAISGSLDSGLPWVLAGIVVFWVAGFDLIYAIQDIEFDRSEQLYSMATRLGAKGTLEVSRVLHGIMFLLMALLGVMGRLGGIYYSGLAIIAAVLVWEHRMALRNTPESIQVAFFRANALISFILMFSILIESLRS